jgi:cytoskeleton protein RodZ
VAIGIGEALRAARADQGRSIDEASRATRVRAEYLTALEEEEFGRIGGDVYAKGFLSTYARWLGLDPAPLLELYKRNVQDGDFDAHQLVEIPVGRPHRDGLPPWLVWSVTAVVILLAAFAVGELFGGRTPDAAVAQRPEAQGTSPRTDTSPSPRPSRTPTPTPTPAGVNLLLLVEDDSWMRVHVESRVVFEGIVPAGESRAFQSPDAIRVRLGNAGGVRLVLNGRQLGSPAARGQIWEGTCTRDACTEVA